MRKLFWGLTVVAVVAVGGMFWMKCQGPGWPCVFMATAVVQHCRHLTGQSDTAADEDLASFEKPDDPIEMADPKDPAPERETGEVVEFTPPPVVPAINIHEPIDVSKPVAVAESGSWTGEATTRPGTEIDPAILQVNSVAVGLARSEIQTAPRVMPYCQDDDEVAPPKMLYATDDDAVEPDEDDDCDDAPEPSIWQWFFPGLGKHTSLKPPLGGQEESELPPPVPKKLDLQSLRQQLQKLMGGCGCGPIFPHIDTMEFRPSDRNRYEHLPNPI
jgi:hypothetical protein